VFRQTKARSRAADGHDFENHDHLVGHRARDATIAERGDCACTDELRGGDEWMSGRERRVLDRGHRRVDGASVGPFRQCESHLLS
jgi:hypothetical protein